MPADRSETVAVIGSGAAGLGAAWLLARGHYNVHLFEAAARPGGHANTVDVPIPGASPPASLPVDTGFIVYNTRTYPDLVSLFELLGVEEENSSMSFASSVYLDSSSPFEWGSDNLTTLFADRANLFRPALYSMLYDLTRFNAAVHDFIDSLSKHPDSFADRNITLGEFLKRGAYSNVFTRAYVVPMVSAVWSASFKSALHFPARTLFHFFVNHGFAQTFARPQWRTPAKRSRDYVNRLLADFRVRGGTVHLSSPVAAVTRTPDFCTLHVAGSDQPFRFDHLVFATHAPDTLAILGDDATADERRILSNFKYSTNKAYVHHDERLMPRKKAVWSSWNFIGQRPDLGKSQPQPQPQPESPSAVTDAPTNLTDPDADDGPQTDRTDPETTTNEHEQQATASEQKGEASDEADDDPVCVSYWLNRLQNYHKYHVLVPDLFITLNPITPIDTAKILVEISYDHPQFTEEAVNAQPELQSVIQGKNRTWFCGAYTRFGFHEDAMMSGLDVAERLSNFTVLRPWKLKNCLAINDNSQLYEVPCSPLRAPLIVFLAALLVINAVISRLQEGLGKIAARMTDGDPVVVVASGEGRLHRFGPKHVRRRTSSFFSFSRFDESSSSSVMDNSPPPAARITVRSPKVLARIADALSRGLELAPIAAGAFAAGELDCPSPTDLSETLRSLFIAHGLDDPSNARKGRAKFAENLLSAIVGNFEPFQAASVHTRLPELTTCMLNVVCPSWWLELDQSSNEIGSKSLRSAVSPQDLKDASRVLELGGDLSELTVAFLQGSRDRHATVVVQTKERINFVKCKAELLFVAEQVSVLLLDSFKRQIDTESGLADEIDKDKKFDIIFSPGLLNNYKSCGFESAEKLMQLIQSVSATNAVIELGVVVYGKKTNKPSLIKHKPASVKSVFSSDDGYRLWEIPEVMRLSEVDGLDIQNVTFLHEEEAAMDIHEVIQRVYNSLAIDKLDPKETRCVLAQMCLWQAALGVKYLRRMAVSFTLK